MVTQLLGELGRNRRRTWRLMAALVVAGVTPAMGVACGGAAGVVVEPEGGAAIAAPTNAPADDVAAGSGDGGLAGAAIEVPTDVPAVTHVPPGLAAGETGQPVGEVLAYPTEFTLGSMLPGHDALDRIAPADTSERQALENELAAMGQGAPTSERVFGLNVSDPDNPSWTSLPGDGNTLYVAVVREGGTTKIDPSLHDWRARNVPGVEFVKWQEVTPPPGADNLRLIANGSTTVIGAYQGDTLVYWFSTEENNGQGDWLPNDSNMPDGAEGYSFDNDRNTWVTRVGDTVFEYRSGVWNEVIEMGAMRDGLWWDGAGWQVLPGEGWQVSVGESGQIQAINPDGERYVYESDAWIPASESYSHILQAPDGSALQEYLDASGARVEPAIHLGDGAFELVPAGEVLPTYIYEPETGWRVVDRDKAIIDEVDTSTWFTATGSAGTIYEGLTMPMRVTTTDLSTLREVTYSKEAQEFYMVYWLRMCHVAYTYQQRGKGETVDFETYVQMVKAGDADAQIYVYRYDLNPDGSRGTLRQQMVDPGKGITIQVVHDREFENNPLATVTNPNNAQPGIAFMLGATEAGQATVAVNADADWIDAISEDDIEERLTFAAFAFPIDSLQWVGLYATSYAMGQSDASSPGFDQIGKDVNTAVKAVIAYLRELLGNEPEYPFWDLVEVEHD